METSSDKEEIQGTANTEQARQRAGLIDTIVDLGLLTVPSKFFSILAHDWPKENFQYREFCSVVQYLKAENLQSLIEMRWPLFSEYVHLESIQLLMLCYTRKDTLDDRAKVLSDHFNNGFKIEQLEELLGINKGGLKEILFLLRDLTTFKEPTLLTEKEHIERVQQCCKLRDLLLQSFPPARTTDTPTGLIHEYFETAPPSLPENLKNLMNEIIILNQLKVIRYELIDLHKKYSGVPVTKKRLDDHKIQTLISEKLAFIQANQIRDTTRPAENLHEQDKINTGRVMAKMAELDKEKKALLDKEKKRESAPAPKTSKKESLKNEKNPVVSKSEEITLFDNLDGIIKAIDKKIEGHVDEAQDKLKTICEPGLLKIAQFDEQLLNEYLDGKLLWSYFKALIRADSLNNAPHIGILLNSIHWDTILEFFGDYMRYTHTYEFKSSGGMHTKKMKMLFGFLKMRELKILIRGFQQGNNVTKKGLKSIFALKVGRLLKFRLLDFNKQVEGLNRLQRGEDANLWEMINVNNINKILAVDLQAAYNPYIPERVQYAEHEHIQHQLFDQQAFHKIRNALDYFFPPFIFWLFLRTFCTSCMESIEPGILTGFPLLVLATWIYLIGRHFFDEPRLKTNLIANTVTNQIGFKVHSYFRQTITPEDINRYIKDSDSFGPLFRSFLKLLSTEHLKKLRNPYTLVELLEDPLKFVQDTTHQPFLMGLTTIEKELVEHRMDRIFHMLYAQCALEDFSAAYQRAQQNFEEILTQVLVEEKLPCPSFLLVSYYNPELLFKNPDFIKSLARMSNEKGETGIDLLYTLIEESKKFIPPTKAEMDHISRLYET